jgi:hypothetical protein
MAWKLGRKFKRGGKTVRYAYRNGKRGTKTLVRKVVNKKNMKKTAKTILVAGVWYYMDRKISGTPEQVYKAGAFPYKKSHIRYRRK